MKYVKSLILLLLTTSLCHAYDKNDSIFSQTVLFKITSPDSKHVSYLFGTHHAYGKSFFDSLTNALELLASAEIMIKENLNIPGHMADDIVNSRSEITHWSRYLSKTNLAFVENIFSGSAMDFHKLTPTELHVFLRRYYNQRICLMKDPTDTSLSLDDYIGSLARDLEMELIGLETTEEQIVLINKDVEGMPRKVHKKRLANVIDKIRSKNKSDCGESRWYRQMEINYAFNEPCRNTLMLSERNDKWMVSIKKHLQTNSCFIAVGLSHLMYECGLINQMSSMGYTITPVPVK